MVQPDGVSIQDVTNPVHGARIRDMGPALRLVASVALRSAVLIGIAMLLILVLLPAVLGAQAASAG